jgi:hypothetical protein
MACADNIKDKGEISSQKNRAAMEECVVKCGDEMIKVLINYFYIALQLIFELHHRTGL